jgi:DNA gyrase/topoisomerase IV subunit B
MDDLEYDKIKSQSSGFDLKYDENSIQSLEDFEAIRARPGMYIQAVGIEGINKLVNEAICNCRDEFASGRGNAAWFIFNESTAQFEIKDNASGIPIGKLKDVISKTHTGAKFNTSAYRFGNGQNGVGLKCICALSKRFEIIVKRDKKCASIIYEQGNLVQDVVVTPDPNQQETGTIVKFIPDIEIFGTLDVKSSDYEDYLDKFAHINAGFAIYYTALLRDGTTLEKKFYSEQGISDYLTTMIQKHKTVLAEPFTIPLYIKTVNVTFGGKSFQKDMGVNLVCNWCSDVRSEVILSFVNGIQTSDGGHHVIGLKKGIGNVIRNDLKSGKFLSKNDPLNEAITREDMFEGFFAVLLALHETPLFDGQTKSRFSSMDYAPFIEEAVETYFGEWTKLNAGKYKSIIDLIILASRARIAASKARNQIKSTSQISGAVLTSIERYTDCHEKSPFLSELFIVEGKSAEGNTKLARDTNQAIYSLQGKPPNSYKILDISNYVKKDNNVIGDMPKILGCGIGKTFDESRIRFDKIIIMTDADYDGNHISALSLGFFYRHMPRLIELGKIYLANPPLYCFTLKKDKRFYLQNDNEYHTYKEKAIMHDFNLCVLRSKYKNIQLPESKSYGIAREDYRVITNKRFYKQFLVYLRNYSNLVDITGKQTNIHPQLLEFIIANYDSLSDPDKLKSSSLGFEGYYNNNSGTWVIEGVYANVLHRIEFTPFLTQLCSKILEQMKQIKWINLALIHKKSGIVVGPSFYTIDKTINLLINKGARITRFKGLGEMSAIQLRETTMDPKTRVLTQITMDELKKEKYDKDLDIYIGDDIESRKVFYGAEL